MSTQIENYYTEDCQTVMLIIVLKQAIFAIILIWYKAKRNEYKHQNLVYGISSDCSDNRRSETSTPFIEISQVKGHMN